MLHIIDLVFLTRTRILSLPLWHGGRWTALLRNVCANAGLHLEDFAAFILPLRSGQAPISQGERLYLRLGLTAPDFLCSFIESFASTAASGEFSAQSLQLAAICDAVGKRLLWLPGERSIFLPEALNEEAVAAEIRFLCSLSAWRLQFVSPLRLPLPQRHPLRQNGDYSPPEFFTDPLFLDNLIARIRFPLSLQMLAQTDAEHLKKLTVRRCSLHWETLRYSAARQMALSGVLGEIKLDGPLAPRLATALVLGQYLGAGKNGRFGLGFWRIPELDACRAINWPA